MRVADLIWSQACLSASRCTMTSCCSSLPQTDELWFKQILHEITPTVVLMSEDRLASAARRHKRTVEIEKLLVNQIHIWKRLTPISFLGFRDELNPASGFQSMQFREIEFASGLRHENLLNEFREDEFAYARLQKRFTSASLSDAFYAALSSVDWISRRMKTRSTK